MLRREILNPMSIVPLAQIQPVFLRVEGCIETRSALLGLIICRPVRQMRSEYKHIACFKRNGDPLVTGFPFRLDASVLGELDFHFVRSRDDFQTAVFDSCGVDGDVCCYVLDAPDVVVSWGVEVGLEAIAVGLFVIDFILEEEHVLFIV